MEWNRVERIKSTTLPNPKPNPNLRVADVSVGEKAAHHCGAICGQVLSDICYVSVGHAHELVNVHVLFQRRRYTFPLDSNLNKQPTVNFKIHIIAHNAAYYLALLGDTALCSASELV